MRDYGRVPISLWLQKYPSDDVRTLLLYVICGPHSNGIGCYRLPPAYIAEDLTWSIERVKTALELSTGKPFGSPSEALAKGLPDTSGSPCEGLIEYDEQTSWVRWPMAFDVSPIASPNGAKSLMPFIDAVPRNSFIFQNLFTALEPFSAKFPKGYMEGLRSPSLGLPKPLASPPEAEQVASSSSNTAYSLQPLPFEDEAPRVNGHAAPEKLDLSDYGVAVVVAAKMVHRRSLTTEDQYVLQGWCKNHDMERVVFPWLEERVTRHLENNGSLPKHPLKYFSAGLTEHLAKTGIK